MGEDYEPQKRYIAANIMRVTVDFNRKTESDQPRIEKIQAVDNKTAYIKGLIRDDVERETRQ